MKQNDIISVRKAHQQTISQSIITIALMIKDREKIIDVALDGYEI